MLKRSQSILLEWNINDLKIKVNLLNLFDSQVFHLETLGSRCLPPVCC